LPGSQGTSTARTLFLVLLALLIGAGALLIAQRLGITGLQAVPPAPVPELRPAPPGVGALGRVEPASRIRRLGPPSTLAVTRVQRLFVQEGEQVHADQLLAEFADADLKDAAVAEAGAKAAEAKAALALVKAGGRPSEIAAQKALIDSLATQQAIMARDAARSATLVTSGAAARAVADRDQAAAERAAANLRQAMDQLITLEHPRPEDVALAEAREQAAEATLATARVNAALSRVYAPVAGEILKIYTRAGDLVGPDGLLEIADLDSLEVVADVYQTDLPRVRVGAPAEVIVPGEPQRYGARIVHIGNLVAHATQAGTDPLARVDGRTAEVRLALLPEGAKALRGRIDMQVQVAIRP
jgi:HlyD family secretion protein